MWFLVKQWLVYVLGTFGGFFADLDRLVVFWTFLTIGLCSGGFMILSMVIGDIFGHEFDHGADGDGHDLGHADHGSEMSTPSVFSFKIMLSFFSAFGLTGAIATNLHQSVLMACLYGIGVGVVMGGLTYGFVMFLASHQGSFNITDADFIGKEARVIVAIPVDGLGQLQLNTGAGSLTKLCRTEDGVAIPEYAIVKIERVIGETVIVSKIS